jgi:hypothetical protein
MLCLARTIHYPRFGACCVPLRKKHFNTEKQPRTTKGHGESRIALRAKRPPDSKADRLRTTGSARQTLPVICNLQPPWPFVVLGCFSVVNPFLRTSYARVWSIVGIGGAIFLAQPDQFERVDQQRMRRCVPVHRAQWRLLIFDNHRWRCKRSARRRRVRCSLAWAGASGIRQTARGGDQPARSTEAPEEPVPGMV